MSGTGHSARHVVVHGRVQGVGYRAWTEDNALLRGVAGWARNCRDGTVEAVFVGPDAVVDELIAACRRGPASARVDAVSVRDATADELKLQRPGDLFSVLPTA